MDNLDDVFSQPSRRELLRWGLAGGACALGAGCVFAQDTAGTGALSGPLLKGVVRRRAMFWEQHGD